MKILHHMLDTGMVQPLERGREGDYDDGVDDGEDEIAYYFYHRHDW